AAASQRGRIAPLGVSMARCTNVETRIHAILDFTRPLSRRLTWSTALLIAALIVPLIALAAALQPASGEPESAAGTESAATAGETAEPSGDKPLIDDATAKTAADPEFVYAGAIVDSQNQPVRNAEVRLAWWQNEPPIDE